MYSFNFEMAPIQIPVQFHMFDKQALNWPLMFREIAFWIIIEIVFSFFSLFVYIEEE